MADGGKHFLFKIDRSDKPLIYVPGEHEDRTSCLIDTGANLPVWFIGRDYLSYRYPDAYDMGKLTILNGLGDNPLSNVPVWVIPSFALRDDNGNTLRYEGLPVAVLDTTKFSFDMIVPLTMINRMDFSFSYRKSVAYAEFEIVVDRDVFYIKPVFAATNPEYLNKIQVLFD